MPYTYRPRLARKDDEPMPLDHKYKSSNRVRSFGYYALGGIDITGENTRLDGQVSYDAEEDINNGCTVDALTDPRVGFMEIAEDMGVETATQAEQIKNDK